MSSWHGGDRCCQEGPACLSRSESQSYSPHGTREAKKHVHAGWHSLYPAQPPALAYSPLPGSCALATSCIRPQAASPGSALPVYGCHHVGGAGRQGPVAGQVLDHQQRGQRAGICRLALLTIQRAWRAATVTRPPSLVTPHVALPATRVPAVGSPLSTTRMETAEAEEGNVSGQPPAG